MSSLYLVLMQEKTVSKPLGKKWKRMNEDARLYLYKVYM